MTRLVTSPDAVIRIAEGRVWLAGRDTAPPTEHDVDVLEWLARFAAPMHEHDVVAAIEPEDRDGARKAIDRLKALSVLVPAGADGPAASLDDASPSEEARRVNTCLAAIANAVHQIAGDVAAFGPYALNRFRAGGGPPLGSRLASTLAGLLSVQGALRAWRNGYVAEQLERLGIRAGACGLKLNIGAGRYPLESWLNIDVHPAQLALDLRWGLGLPEGAAQWIVLMHVLEHLYFPGEAEGVLKELRRVLAPGGVLRIAVPDIEKGLRAYADDDTQFFDDRQRTWTRVEPHTKLDLFLSYAGAGPNPGAFLSAHKFGYDFETLEYLLRRAGFTVVERSDYMQSRHDALRVDYASRVAGAMFGARYYSLFVEASG